MIPRESGRTGGERNGGFGWVVLICARPLDVAVFVDGDFKVAHRAAITVSVARSRSLIADVFTNFHFGESVRRWRFVREICVAANQFIAISVKLENL